MGWKTLTAIAGAAFLLAASVPAHADDGLTVDRANATFRITRKGLPNHSVKLRGFVTDSRVVDSFDAATTGLRVKMGDFTAFFHNPSPESADDFKFKRGVWRFRTKVNGVRTKLRLDVNSGRLVVDLRKANAGLLEAGDPDYVVCSIEIGTRLFEDALVFDVRGRSGSQRWSSLAKGSPLTPPGPPPTGDPKPKGSMPFVILTRDEQSQVLQPTVMVARTDAEWQAMYDLGIFSGPNRRPDVDFTQEMVIGVFTGLVNQIHRQRTEFVNVTDTGNQLQVSWRSRYLCTSFPCSGGLNPVCPDYSPFVFVRVRRVETDAVSNRAPDVYDDCP